ncbi:MAG: tRNA (adenosine(37)-N6)-threonylcarbamoyltransferase complex ATPase subunit type 1 TsaE [Treponema sp.]|nr:MAG: tRNA (adenosine(37)-N6)-threonylcarbamoyltransferase complex ATPase subunit type 1 TsaE [Treponema sp.]
MKINKAQTRTASTESEMICIGKKIGKILKAGDVVTLDGTLGAGKTCLTKGIALGLDITETITSPTFTIISEYDKGRLHLYHIDVYRLECANDFWDIGGDEMLFGTGVCIIEWAEKIEEAIPEKAIKIHIEINKDGSRKLSITNAPENLT